MVDTFQTKFLPEGLATGIGSLPFVDPEEALNLIFAELPEMPHWPQLPQRGAPEHFVYQFLRPLLDCGMLAADGGRWIFDTSRENSAACLTEFYTSCLSAVGAYGSRFLLALSREMIIEDLNFIFGAIQSENALAGIHCCEAVDWSLLLETQASK